MSTSKPAQPVILDTPTLGRAVRLGELYDVRSGKFLGVQLYPETNVKEVETDIRHTELTVSLSTTHHQKATLLDVNAELSLSVLGGLIKVTGSASYLNDEKSNTNEYAYALALKMRLKEKRILFAENPLGRAVLTVVTEDYITTDRATHFVSSIVYGGNYIVNLVARQTEMSKEEKIEGKLQASFDKLKGLISLDGSVEAKVKGEFKDMDDKFDLVVHGDVALQKVPITPKDVLDTFPEAASLITDGGGVPISVTLQPIPHELYKAGIIHKIDGDLVDVILAAFSDLDDLRSRFLVLQDNAKRLKDFVPELARTTRLVMTTYIVEHNKLLHRLATFLQSYKSGETPEHEQLLADVGELYSRHGKPGEYTDVSKQYPSTLVGLEEQLSRFQYLIADIRTVRFSLENHPQPEVKAERSIFLSSLEDVCRAIRTQNETPFFVMVPISGVKNYDLVVLKYLAMIRKYADKFWGISNTAHMYYAESLKNLEDRLPNNGSFEVLTVPSFYVATVNEDGDLSWVFSPPPSIPIPSETYALEHIPSAGTFGRLSLPLSVEGDKAYSIMFRAKEAAQPSTSDAYTILALEGTPGNALYLSFHSGFGVGEKDSSLRLGYTDKKPKGGETFMGTFVQDTGTKQWILYLNGDEVDRKTYDESKLVQKLQVGYPPGTQWWNGEVLDIKAFPRALTKDQIQKAYTGLTG